MAREQRFVFGEVAALYDRARPGYPPDLIEDVIASTGSQAGGRAGGRPGGATPKMLEAGAGTGKATVAFARRGLAIVALEPNADMAAIAARACAAYPDVEVVVATFEEWEPRRRTAGSFDLVVAAQSWHWLAPNLRCTKSADLLRPDGALALFWNLPIWEDTELRDALDEVYATHTAGLGAAPIFPRLHASGEGGRIVEEIESCGAFGAVDVHLYRWVQPYTTEEYLDLSSTHSDHRLLPEAVRQALLSDVAGVLDRRGGGFDMVYEARLYLTRRRA